MASPAPLSFTWYVQRYGRLVQGRSLQAAIVEADEAVRARTTPAELSAMARDLLILERTHRAAQQMGDPELAATAARLYVNALLALGSSAVLHAAQVAYDGDAHE